MKSFRHPSETPIYYLTLLMLGGIVAFSALPTVCLMPLLVLGFIALSYWMSQSHHKQLLSQAYRVTPQSTPRLAALAQDCLNRLRLQFRLFRLINFHFLLFLNLQGPVKLVYPAEKSYLHLQKTEEKIF